MAGAGDLRVIEMPTMLDMAKISDHRAVARFCHEGEILHLMVISEHGYGQQIRNLDRLSVEMFPPGGVIEDPQQNPQDADYPLLFEQIYLHGDARNRQCSPVEQACIQHLLAMRVFG